MNDASVMTSVLSDAAFAAECLPYDCPCDFGGRYRLEEAVGIGPRAWVYRGVDRALSEEGHAAEVAIKVYRGAATEEESLLARRVVHANALRVLDRGRDGLGRPYLVMEYVQGGDLQGVGAPLPARRAAALVEKVARAVQAAHDKGVLHCDIKPGNVLMTAGGEPKLADFDLAARVGDDARGRRGTPAFMAPEQYAGGFGSLTPAGDVYALGGLLYYLLTGRAPHGETMEEITEFFGAQRGALFPGTAAPLRRIGARALAWERSERYRSAGEMADELRRFLEHRPLAGDKPSAVRRALLWCRRHPTAAVAAAAVTLGGIGSGAGAVWWRQEQLRRDLLARNEAVELAQEQLERIKAKARKQIEDLSRSIFGGTGQAESVLPALVWVQWLGDDPALASDGSVAAGPERLEALERMLQAAEAQGAAAGVEALVTRFAAGRIALSMDQGERARGHLRGVLAHLEETGPNDPFRTRCEVLLLCAEVLQEDKEAAAEALRGLTRAEHGGRLFVAGPAITREVQRIRKLAAGAGGPARGAGSSIPGPKGL